jgi:hypothetical protein
MTGSPMSDRKLLQELALHLVMGASLGAVFAVVLLTFNAEHLLDVILHSSAPAITLVVFVFGVSVYFGFGAAITGFHFVIMENDFDRRR